MIEVRKLIPQVYNQSRDFSVFMGILQALINEADINSLRLSKLPSESLLPYELSTYDNLRGYFRFMLKEKGSIESILQAISMAGGKIICKLEEESVNLELTSDDWDYTTVDRYSVPVGLRGRVVYYYDRKLTTGSGGPHLPLVELNINLKDPSQVDQGLLDRLLYYIKPVNVVIRLHKGEN
jgi:hypothetical protein